MGAMAQAADARTANFVAQEYNKQVQTNDMILMINNEHLEPNANGGFVAVHD